MTIFEIQTFYILRYTYILLSISPTFKESIFKNSENYMKLCTYERQLLNSALLGKTACGYLYTSPREKFRQHSSAPSATSTSLTSLNMLLDPSACDLLSVLWTDYILSTSSDHLYIPQRIVFARARPSKIQGREMRKKVFPANRGRRKFAGKVNSVKSDPRRRQWGGSNPGTRYALTQILDPLQCRG